MPNLRSETIRVNHTRRINNDEQITVTAPKPAKSAKTIVPNRGEANEEENYPPVVVVQAETIRSLFSMAPQLGTHVLFLFVGEARELMTLHTDLLPEATKRYIIEQNQGQQIYQLPDEDAGIVDIYRKYLYTNKIFSSSDEDADMLTDETHADSEWTTLAHCYVLGIAIKDEKFANACINAIIEKISIEDLYPTGMASEVYEYTEEDDKLRKLIVDMHVLKGLGQWIEAPHDDAEGPKEFLQDVIRGLAAASSDENEWDGPMPWVVNKCAYHSHEVTARCEG